MKYFLLITTILQHSSCSVADQEKISESFYKKLATLANTNERPVYHHHTTPQQRSRHIDAWQSMYNAANDAFQIFKKYEAVKHLKKKHDFKPVVEEPRHSFKPVAVDTGSSLQRKKNDYVLNTGKFVSYQAVPAVPKIELLEPEPVVEYIPFSQDLLINAYNTTSSTTTTMTYSTTTSTTSTAPASTSSTENQETDLAEDDEDDPSQLMRFIVGKVFELTNALPEEEQDEGDDQTKESIPESTGTPQDDDELEARESPEEEAKPGKYYFKDNHGLDFYFPDVLKALFY